MSTSDDEGYLMFWSTYLVPYKFILGLLNITETNYHKDVILGHKHDLFPSITVIYDFSMAQT